MLTFLRSPALDNGVTFAVFHLTGNAADCSEQFINFAKDGAIIGPSAHTRGHVAGTCIDSQFPRVTSPFLRKRTHARRQGLMREATGCNFSRSSSPDCCKFEHPKIFEIKESEIQLRYLLYVSSVKGKKLPSYKAFV